MKLSFRTIALGVIAIMGCVFAYQLYWLNGLYKTSNLELEKSIYEAMGVADQNELFIRVTDIGNNDSLNVKLQLGAHVEEDSLGQQIYYSEKKVDGNGSYGYNTDEVWFNRFKENARTTEKLAAFIQKALHASMDTIVAINMERYDSLLTVELKKLGIDDTFRIYNVKAANDSVCGTPPRHDASMVPGIERFDYHYDIEGLHMYRLLIDNPNQKVLWQMGGIVATSFVIFGLLIYVFVYLLRTIRKLQTEEELKANFTNNMTHELKTPIAVSYAAVDALLVADKPADRERQQRYLQIAKDQMNHLSGLVEQILSMSRRNNNRIDLRHEVVDLQEVTTGLTEKLSLLSDKPIEVETRFDTPTVTADKLHLTNILNNLMENGIKYSADKIRLTISATYQNGFTVLSVADNGIGIDPRHHHKLFDKFYRVPTGNRHNVKGFGLGLFYVKQMAERHGGAVEVKSQLGKGSVFTIKIPQ
ncbi:MAG: HAMP domain-containing sensor histidine kinase [Breznakibacter sp.]